MSRKKQRGVSCRAVDWATVQEYAEDAGMSASAWLITRALTVELTPEPEPEEKISVVVEQKSTISDEEEREVFDRLMASAKRLESFTARIPEGMTISDVADVMFWETKTRMMESGRQGLLDELLQKIAERT